MNYCANLTWLQLVRSLTITAMVAASLTQPAMAQVAIPAKFYRDLAYDDAREILYITTASGTVLRFDAQAERLMEPFVVEELFPIKLPPEIVKSMKEAGDFPILNGVEVTPNGDYVYVGLNGFANRKWLIRRFNADTWNHTDFYFAVHELEGGAADLAMTNAGHALLLSSHVGSGNVYLRKLDLKTHEFAFEEFEKFGKVGPYPVPSGTKLFSSPDGNLVLYIEGRGSNQFGLYDARARKIVAKGESGRRNRRRSNGTFNRDGKTFAITGEGIDLYDMKLRHLGTVEGFPGPAIYSPTRDILYSVDGLSNEIVALEISGFKEIERFPIGEDVNDGFEWSRDGTMVISKDGNRLFVTTPSGVRMLTVGGEERK